MVVHNSKLVDFTNDGTVFGQCTPDGVLRVWDSTSGIFLNEYTPANTLAASITCIKFAPLEQSASKKRKKRNSGIEKQPQKLIALGTLSGNILVYDYATQELLWNLNHSGSSAVNEVCWASPTVLYSLGANKKVHQWNISNGETTNKFSVDKSTCMCLLGSDHMIFSNTGIQIRQLSDLSSEPIHCTGHSSSIISLVSLTGDDKYFLSAADDDRFISVWNREQNEVITGSLLVRDNVNSISTSKPIDNSVQIAVSTLKGSLRIFNLHLNGKSGKPLPSFCMYKIASGKTAGLFYPIIASHFIKEDTLIIVYKNGLMLQFEQITTNNKTNLQTLTRDIEDTAPRKETSLLKVITPKVDRDTTYVCPISSTTTQISSVKRKHDDTDGEKVLPMEERLSSMMADHKFSVGSKPPKSDNCSQLLLQALHSKDATLITTVLSQGKDELMVNNTIRRLPSLAVVPLIQHLQTYTTTKNNRKICHMVWLKAILYHHMGYLSSLQDRQKLISPFYTECSGAINTQNKFKQLQSRLDIILTQMSSRKNDPGPNVEEEAMLVYRDESSDDESATMDMKFGASDTDDNWDDFSDIAAQSEESEMETDAVKLQEIKKVSEKAENESDFSSSDDDDDDNDVDIEESTKQVNGISISSGDSDSDEKSMYIE